MSNCHDADESVVERRKKHHRGKLTVDAPLVASRYNVHMTAIDDIDRVRELLSTRLRIHKWYLALFFFFFSTQPPTTVLLSGRSTTKTPAA
mmetsp:Transcript_68972/g.143809  ORF Transcript_68972/g.143809 Transcript_68972/m.143809 type:complete len:91 (+) Transcript_68972:1496-1768(+)